MTSPIERAARVPIRLTPARKRAILSMRTDGTFCDYEQVMRRRSTRMALTNAGITEPYVNGPVTMYHMVRLTPLGLAIRARLESPALVAEAGM